VPHQTTGYLQIGLDTVTNSRLDTWTHSFQNPNRPFRLNMYYQQLTDERLASDNKELHALLHPMSRSQ
jgi:hypothetical protein